MWTIIDYHCHLFLLLGNLLLMQSALVIVNALVTTVCKGDGYKIKKNCGRTFWREMNSKCIVEHLAKELTKQGDKLQMSCIRSKYNNSRGNKFLRVIY